MLRFSLKQSSSFLKNFQRQMRLNENSRLIKLSLKGKCSSTASNYEDKAITSEKLEKNTGFDILPPKPFDELDVNKDSSNLNAEFLDDLGPPLPISFNLAAYVNRSESLIKLVQLGVDLSVLEKDPKKAKFILKLDFEKDMKGHIQFLHDHGVESDYLGKFLTKNPFVFEESLQNLEIRINYLRSKKFPESSISRILMKNPFILSMSTKDVDRRLGFFQKQFSLTGDEVRYLATKCPKLISYNFEKFREKLFLTKEVFGFSAEEMKTFLMRKPKVWMLGSKVLQERFAILHNLMGLSHERILEYPGSLLKRGFLLKQRHLYLVHLGRAQYDPTQPNFISLHDLATTTDNAFCKKCAKTSIDLYNEFLRTL